MDCVDDKNPKDSEGVTALHLASGNGHMKICQLIMDYLDDKNPKDNRGRTPLHLAAGKCYKEYCHCEIECWEDLHRLPKGGYLEICKLITQHLDDKNPKDNDGKNST